MYITLPYVLHQDLSKAKVRKCIQPDNKNWNNMIKINWILLFFFSSKNEYKSV